MDMDLVCKQLIELARPYLTVRENQKHMEISLAFARGLLEHLGGREEIVLPAIILHDVGWSAIPTDLHLLAFGPDESDREINRIHEVEGAKIAATILEKVNLKQECRLEICRIIENHDSGIEASTKEEKIVKDADKLFRFSPEGFSIDTKRFGVNPKEYHQRLHQFKELWFLTETGRQLAIDELSKVELILK